MHIGRPSRVIFPTELLEQGLSLVLSGLNNTMAFQSNPDWVWPYWYERQRDPSSPQFIPTGMNLVTSNLVLRNWTSIGLPGSTLESLIDPVGMLTLKPYGWSVFPYLRFQGKDWIPPLMAGGIRQHLADDVWPEVVTEYHIDHRLAWESTVRSIAIGSEELVAFTHILENLDPQPLSLTFGLAIRPYNPLSISHINRIKLRDGLWRVNHQPALWMLDKPDWVTVGDRNHIDPLFADRAGKEKTSHSSKSGIATGIAEFDIVLAPGERRTLESIGTLHSGKTTLLQKFDKPNHTSLQVAKESVQRIWEDRSATGMQLQLPDRRWQTAFSALRNRLYVFDDNDHFSPGTYFYHHHWVRDSAFISMAYATLGWTDDLRGKAYGMLGLQTADGFFRSQNGEWDSNGEALYSLANYAQCSGDIECLEKFWPHALKACRWIDRKKRETRNDPAEHRGLLPAGFSAEHFGPNDHYYWDNFWSIAGLSDALWMAETQGAHESVWIREVLGAYRDDLSNSIRLALTKSNGTGLPSSPYRRVDSASIGNLVALAPLDLYPATTPWLQQTVDTLYNECMHDGMFFQKIIHTGLNAYLSIQLARAMLAMDDMRWIKVFTSVLEHATPTWTWPEAIHPGSLGGCMGDGDHGWAAAEVVSFLASLMVRIQDNALQLGRGIPRNWYHGDNRFGVKSCTTRGGNVSWEIVCQGNQARLDWDITRNRLQRKIPVYFQLPRPQGLVQPYLTDHADSRRMLRLDEDRGSIELRIV